MKIIGKIFAVLFSIIYFFVFMALMIVAFSSNFLSTNYYTRVLKNIDLKTMKVEDLGDLFDDIELEEDATVEDVLIKYFEEGGVDYELTMAIINNEKIREVLGKFIGEYVNYNIGGEKPKIERKDVEAIFNEPVVKELLDQSPEKIDIDIDKIYNELQNLVDEILEDGGADNDRNSKSIEVNPIIN